MTTLPWFHELTPAPDPLAVCAHLASRPFALFLDSALPQPALGRYSFIMADPFAILTTHGERSTLTTTTGDEPAQPTHTGDPLTFLQQLLRPFAQPTLPGLPPFQGGAAGYWGYELGQRLVAAQPIPDARSAHRPLPDMALGFYDWALAWDHLDPQSPRCWLISTGWPALEPALRLARAQARAADVLTWLYEPAPPLPAWPAANAPSIRSPRRPLRAYPDLTSTCMRAEYLAMTRQALAHIAAGDIYQVNLSQQMRLPRRLHPWQHYLQLRRANPAPFAAYLALPHLGAAILSASPERFLQVHDGHVVTRPIKGTRPRGRTPHADAVLRAALLASAKDRAENVMIVDLLRNDLSKVCRPFSVRTPELCCVESYATVHHLVSTVVGQLRPDLDAVDLLRACFPGGSITGAPKVRAMQIIAALEPTARGVYCGAIGYLGFDGALDTSIAIRTAVASGDDLQFGVGGGIVADSLPAGEYRETLHKAAGLLQGLRT